MTRFLPPVALASSLLATTATVYAQPSPEEPPPSPDSATNHWEGLLIAGSLIVAGIGGGVLLWKRRNEISSWWRKDRPTDGVKRTPGQLRAYQEMVAFERTLDGTERAPRRPAVAGLVNLVPSLVAVDRKRTLQRLALQFCVEWDWLMKDEAVDRTMRSKALRWPEAVRKEISNHISRRMNDPQKSVQINAAAAFKWFQGK